MILNPRGIVLSRVLLLLYQAKVKKPFCHLAHWRRLLTSYRGEMVVKEVERCEIEEKESDLPSYRGWNTYLKERKGNRDASAVFY